MKIRFVFPGVVDFEKNVTKNVAIEIAKSWLREYPDHTCFYLWKPLRGLNKGRYRCLCVVTPRDLL